MKTVNYAQKAVEAYRFEFSGSIDSEWLSTYYSEVLPAHVRTRMSYEVFQARVERIVARS